MNPDEQLSELLQAERSTRPAASAADNGWRRLAADIAANVQPLPIGTGALKSGIWLVPKWILAGLVLGAVGVGITSSAVTPNLAASARGVGSPGPAALALASASVVAAASATEQAEPMASASAPNAHGEAIAARSVAVPGAAGPATFDAEMALISRAKAELDAHQFALARADLAQHATLFPQGVFATERDALRVLVSCEQGPKNATLATGFEAQHPGSPLFARLERACASALPSGVAPLGASADFSKLPNGEAVSGERMAEPSTGEQR